MFNKELIDGLKIRYVNIHPMIFKRSVERAKTPGELFDILETCPKKLPIVWDETNRRWICTDDLIQVSKFDMGVKND